MEQYVMGIDNGGTVCKAAIFDLHGREIACASRKTPVSTPKPGYMERDMLQLWQANCACIREAVARSGLQGEQIAAVAVCGHGKGLYTVDKNGQPARAGIASTDSRAWDIPEQWRREGVLAQLKDQLCQQLIPCQQAALLAWVKKNEPQVYRNIGWVFSVKDYIRFCLTGEAYSEYTDLSGSGLMDVKNARIDPQLLQALGIGEAGAFLPPIRHSHELCGTVTKAAAAETGLTEGTPVAGGMFDIDACALACDVTTPERLCVVTGTWSINEYISRSPDAGEQVAMSSLFAIPGYYLHEECSATGAGNLEWSMPLLSTSGAKATYAGVDALVASAEPESNVFYLPFLYGSNAHPLAKASFVGLTSYHSQAHLARAVYEGVAFSHKTHISRLLCAREAPSAVRLAGGAANSSIWVQLFADVLSLPVETLSGTHELGALGAAMAAAVAVGAYPDYVQAAHAMSHTGEKIMPNPQNSAIMQKKYETYAAVSSALDGVWQRFAV